MWEVAGALSKNWHMDMWQHANATREGRWWLKNRRKNASPESTTTSPWKSTPLWLWVWKIVDWLQIQSISVKSDDDLVPPGKQKGKGKRQIMIDCI